MLIKKATVSAVSLGLAVFSAALLAQDLNVNAARVTVDGPESCARVSSRCQKQTVAVLVEGIEGEAGISCSAPGRTSCNHFKHGAEDKGCRWSGNLHYSSRT